MAYIATNPDTGEQVIHVDGEWKPYNEDDFQRWYGFTSRELGIDPDPDKPEHFYDYRSAYASGVNPLESEDQHWPSKFKHWAHPDRYKIRNDFVEDTITGEPVKTASNEETDEHAYYDAGAGRWKIFKYPEIDPGKTFIEGTKDVVRSAVRYLKEADEASWRAIYGDTEKAKERHEKEVEKDFLMRQVNAKWLKPDGTLKRPEGFKGYAQDVIRMAPQIGAQIGITVGGGPVAGAGFMGTQIAGGRVAELEAEGVKSDRAWKAAIADAMMQAPLEQIGMAKALKFWKPSKAVQKILGKGRVAGAAEGAFWGWLTETLQKYPELATNIWAKGEGLNNNQRINQFIEGSWQAFKEGAYEGAVAAPFEALTGGFVSSKKTTESKKTEQGKPPSEYKDQILNVLVSGEATVEDLKAAKANYTAEQAAVIDEAISEFQASKSKSTKDKMPTGPAISPMVSLPEGQTFELKGKPYGYSAKERDRVARERTQQILNQIDIDSEQDLDIAIDELKTAKKRLKDWQEIQKGSSETDRIEAGRKLKEADRLGLKLDADERKRLEALAAEPKQMKPEGKRAEVDYSELTKTGEWTEKGFLYDKGNVEGMGRAIREGEKAGRALQVEERGEGQISRGGIFQKEKQVSEPKKAKKREPEQPPSKVAETVPSKKAAQVVGLKTSEKGQAPKPYPFDQTVDEYLESEYQRYLNSKPLGKETDFNAWKASDRGKTAAMDHEMAVRDAVKRGVTVRERVIREYPELSESEKPKPEIQKEPWEMTRDEVIWGNYIPSGKNTERALKAQVKLWQNRYDSLSDTEKATRLSEDGIIQGLLRAKRNLEKANVHRNAVEKALSEGKSVPQEVLKDYPDLAPKPVEPTKAAPKEAKKKPPSSPEKVGKRAPIPENNMDLSGLGSMDRMSKIRKRFPDITASEQLKLSRRIREKATRIKGTALQGEKIGIPKEWENKWERKKVGTKPPRAEKAETKQEKGGAPTPSKKETSEYTRQETTYYINPEFRSGKQSREFMAKAIDDAIDRLPDIDYAKNFFKDLPESKKKIKELNQQVKSLKGIRTQEAAKKRKELKDAKQRLKDSQENIYKQTRNLAEPFIEIHAGKATYTIVNSLESLEAFRRNVLRSKASFEVFENLKSATGSSELANDILRKAADLIIDGVETFGRFRREMQKAFKSVWDKIRKHMRALWNVVNNQRGQVDVWHGSPHYWKKPDTSKIGTGEGQQSFGWGLYFTSQRGIARHYAKALQKQTRPLADIIRELSQKEIDEFIDYIEDSSIPELLDNIPQEGIKEIQEYLIEELGNGGVVEQQTFEEGLKSLGIKLKEPSFIYKAIIHKGKDPSEYTWLDWDKPVSERIKPILKERGFGENQIKSLFERKITGEQAYKYIASMYGEKEASMLLLRHGIDGIRYPAGTLSGGGKGTNYVVFDENAITIEKITDLLGNEIGSSELINDIAYKAVDIIRSGANTLEKFSRQMQAAFTDIWDKLKKHIKAIYESAKQVVANQRGSIPLKGIGKEKAIKKTADDILKDIFAEPKATPKEIETAELADKWHEKISSMERPFNDFMYWIVDKNRPINTIQRKLDNISDEIDVFLKETQRPKITAARIQQAWDEDIKPLLEQMAKRGITIPELEEYAHAKHAPEANQALREANAKRYLDALINALPKTEKKDGTRKIIKDVSEFRKKIKREEEAYQNAFRRMFGVPKGKKTIPRVYHELLIDGFEKFGERNEQTKKLKEQWDKFSEKPSGMADNESSEVLKKYEGDENIEAMRVMLSDINNARLDLLYDAGLLSNEEYETIKSKYEFYVPLYREGYSGKLFGASRGLKPSGRPVKVRGGSTRNVVNIIANSISNYEKAINMAEKARSTRALKDLVRANPDPDLWALKKEKKSPRHDKYGNLQMYPDLFNIGDNEFRFMSDGEQYILEVNRDNKDAMLMLRTLKAEDSGHHWLLNGFATINRWLARVNTSWSPEFIISNFARDLQTAGINIKDTGVKGKRLFRGALKSARAIYKVERGKETGSELEALYKRFKASGGKISWADVHSSVEKLSKKITHEIEMLSGKRPTRKMLKEWGKLISDMNTSVENGIRLHVFNLATKQGITDERAAQIASDITVDFTKKGAAGPAINSLYLFANAGIQGTYRIFKAAGKSRAVQGSLVSILGVGFITGLLNSWAGEDDDGEDYFNKIDDFVRERNAIFMLPGTKGKYVKIPLPWGYNFVWNVGVEASRAFTKDQYKSIQGAMRLGVVFVNSFNPVASGTLLQTLLPTVLDPYAQVESNKNWYGGPLMPEKNKFAKIPSPDSQRYWKSARTGSKWVTYQLNKMTGGDKVKPGAIDVSPETVDLIIDTVGGSALRFFTDIGGIPLKAVRKEKQQIHKMPFTRRVYGEQSEWADSKIYYQNIQEILTVKEQLKAYRGTEYYKQIFQDSQKQREMFGLVENTESRLKKLRKLRKSAEIRNDTKNVDKINKKIRDRQAKFNKQYQEKMKGQGK